MATADDWLDKIRAVKAQARKMGSTEIFLQPVFKGKTVVLEYRDLKLRIRDLDPVVVTILRKSGVPRFLYNATYKNWGGHSPAVLYVHGKIVRSRKDSKTRRFIATHVCGKGDVEYHNQLTSIHLLFARGFYTPMANSSWMKTDELQPKALRARLKFKRHIRVETIDGKAFSAVEPIALKAYDCMGWVVQRRKKKK